MKGLGFRLDLGPRFLRESLLAWERLFYALILSSVWTVGDGVGDVFLRFGEAVGDGVGDAFLVERFRCLRVGTGVGVGSKIFLILGPNDSSDALIAWTVLSNIATISSHLIESKSPL